MHDLLLGPAFHPGLEQLEDLRFTGAQELQRTVGEDHTESERGAVQILFEDAHLVVRTAPLQKETEEETGRAGTDDGCSHERMETPTVSRVGGSLKEGAMGSLPHGACSTCKPCRSSMGGTAVLPRVGLPSKSDTPRPLRRGCLRR